MSGHMKQRHTDTQNYYTVIIRNRSFKENEYHISMERMREIEALLKKYAKEEDEKPIEWEVLAKERIQKYKKAGLVLRGVRYRDNLSQKELAKKSGISQNEISKIENGKRVIGEKVAKKLAKALKIDYLLLLEV